MLKEMARKRSLVAIAIVLAASSCDQAPERGPQKQARVDVSGQIRPLEVTIPPSSGEHEKLLESLAGEIHLQNGEVIGTIELSGGIGSVLVTPPGMGNGDLRLLAGATRIGEADIDLALTDPNDGQTLGMLILAERERGRPDGTLTILDQSWQVTIPVIAELEGPIDYDLDAEDTDPGS